MFIKKLWQQAEQGRLPHALLWIVTAKEQETLICNFAQALLCENPQSEQACGQCKSCQLLTAQTHPDYCILAPEANETISIDLIRGLTDFCEQTPQCGDKKIIIIPQAQRMNQSASNALLKTLEEPANNTYFFLSTDILAAISATIRSRCQIIRLPLTMPMAPTWQADFFKDCDALLNQKIDPLAMAAKWQKENLLDLLTQMEIFFSKKRAFVFFDKIIALRKIVSQHNNVNSQLQLESILIALNTQ